MSDGGGSSGDQASAAVVLTAMRGLCEMHSHADARRLAEDLVVGLGGSLVPGGIRTPDVMSIDVSFGDGPPVYPAATVNSPTRALLEEHLPEFVHDAERALQMGVRIDQLADKVSIDLLTGLPDREMVLRALGRLSDDDAVIVLDLDHFRYLNEQLGTAAGDQVLRDLATVLRSTARGRDMVGRLHGATFVVIIHPSVGAEIFLHRLHAAWGARAPYPVTFSAGITRPVGDGEATLQLAESALQAAKRSGRDQWTWADSDSISA